MSDPLTRHARLPADVGGHDFFQIMRLLECAAPGKPRIGMAAHPRDESVRLAQAPELAFHANTLERFEPAESGATARLSVHFFGLYGPHGALPTHLTEYIRDRARQAQDLAPQRFLDMFQHRMLSLFYRAWAQARPTLSHDRPDEDRFAEYLGSLFGLGTATLRERDTVPDAAKLHFAGLLASRVRSAAGLARLLAGYFGLPVRVEENVGRWLDLPWEERSRIGGHGRHAALGRSAVCGARVRDVQHAVRIVFGPLTLADYASLLPGGGRVEQVRDWLGVYLRDPLDTRIAVGLHGAAVPVGRLGRAHRACVLGRTCWLGPQVRRRARADHFTEFLLPRAIEKEQHHG